MLDVFTRTDTITDQGVQIETALTARVSLDITASPGAKCWMAGNPHFVYVGTDVSTTAVTIDKKSLAVTDIGGGLTSRSLRISGAISL
jgi:hypothetical protein